MNNNNTEKKIFEEKYKKSKLSFEKIKDKMIKYDKDMHKLYKKKQELFKKPDFRYYTKKNNNLNNVENIYLTSVFISEEYIPGALVLAYSLKKVKSKFPVVCMVQDVSYEEDGKILFEGISKDTINNLLEIFDMVIGVNLLKIKNFNKNPLDSLGIINRVSSTYKNVLYYVTKAQCLALTQFKKILYLDSSNYIVKNIDNVFKNNLSTFINDNNYRKTGMGYHGAFALIIPNLIYYYKLMFLINNYDYYFNNLFFSRPPDEITIFFSIFPNWNNYKFPKEYKCSPKFTTYNITGTPIDKLVYKNQSYCNTMHFQIYKPFRKKPDEFTNDDFEKTALLFNVWDKLANELLKKNPNLKIYFEHIPKIRKENIFNHKNSMINKKKKEKDVVKAIVKSKKSKIIKKSKKVIQH